MAKPKSKTIMERYGYSEPDLKNATHDRGVIEVGRPTVGEKLLKVAAGLEPDFYRTEGFESWREVEVKDRNWIVGFIDVLLTCDRHVLDCPRCQEWDSERLQALSRVRFAKKAPEFRTWDYMEGDERKRALKLMDEWFGGERPPDPWRKNDVEAQKALDEWNERHAKKLAELQSQLRDLKKNRACHKGLKVYVESRPLVVEVKTARITLGELLRQINTYRSHYAHDQSLVAKVGRTLPNTAVYFTSWTCDYADVLEEEDVICFHAQNTVDLKVVEEEEEDDDADLFRY